jgi:lipoprotein-anchoring transpeptidase ErfK/SrfK
VKLAALTIVIIGNLLANQVHAEDVSPQPLTRLDCDKADMAWDENANVCSANSRDVTRQPLTRHECEHAGMAWNDNAHVCGEKSQAAEAMPQAPSEPSMLKSEMSSTLSQPLTRRECEHAGMAWNDNAHVCGEKSQAAEAMPQVPSEPSMLKAEMSSTLSQPLTRHECEHAGMAWNDNAHVCGDESQAVAAVPESERPDALSQPLTRHQCDEAGRTWNDTGNVCGETLAQPTPLPETNTVASTVLININKATQKMSVFVDGVQQHEWPVSTGLRGYTTPSGTYTASSMNEIWYSKQWDNAPMPHAVFFTKEGHAIHGTYEEKRLGKPASHGCVRIARANAATLYALVAKTGLKNTQVVLAGLTPGGEGKVASSAKFKSSYRRAMPYFADSFPQRPRRGVFRRLFGRL